MLVDSFYVSQPSVVGGVLWDWISSGSILPHVAVTLLETGLGFIIGAALGMVSGIIMGANNRLGRVLSPFVTALYSVPRLALVPLFVLWFGIGLASKLVFVTMVVFFLVFFNTFQGVRDVSVDLINVLRVLGAGRWTLLRKVSIPSAMTWIIAGLRVSVPYALVAAVTAEIVSSNRGLGYLLVRSANQFFVEGVFAAILCMVVVAMILNLVVTRLDGYLLKWKHDPVDSPHL